MKRSKILLYFAIVTAVFSLVLGVAFNQEYVRILVPLVLGGFWVFTIHQKWIWGSSFCAFGLLLYASLLHNVGEIWLFTCLLACLIAWDLSNFLFDIQLIELIRQQDRIEHDHLTRLTFIVGLSIIILSISRAINMNLRFGWVLVLALVLIFGFSRAIIMIRKSQPNG